MPERIVYSARVLCGGSVSGPALVSHERLSFHALTKPALGVFTGPTAETAGKSFVGRVLIFRSGRGASPGARILDLACRHGNRPLAVVNSEAEPIMVQGCALEGIPFAVVEDLSLLDAAAEGDRIELDAARGTLTVCKP